MLALCRDNALRGLHGWMKSSGISVPRKEQERVQTLFADYLSRNRIARIADFDAVLRDRGICLEDHRLSYHIRLAEYAGLLCSGDLFPLKHSYALVRDKLPRAKTLDKEEALSRLAEQYFRSHGPATLEDFVWWSGLSTRDCRSGIAALGDGLLRERWHGLEFLRHRDSRTRGFRSGSLQLLPPYDEYLIGYKSRHVALHPDHSHRAHNQRGIFWPVVLLDGEVAGNWSAAGGKVRSEIFDPEIRPDPDVLQAETERYMSFSHLR